MKNIFCGLIFVLLYIVFSFGNSTIDFLPDFVGFALIFAGAKAMIDKNKFFKKIAVVAGASVILGAAVWVINAFAFFSETWCFIFGLPLVASTVIMLYYITRAVKDIEERSKVKLKASTLKRRFWCYATALTLSYFVIFFFPQTFVILETLTDIEGFLLIFTFFQIKNIYYET